MLGKSKKSTVVATRLPNEILDTIKDRVENGRGSSLTVSEYIRRRIIYDITRKHQRRKEE